MKIKDLIKSGVIIDAAFLAEQERRIIPVTPSTDIALTGGIPEGSWVSLSGREKSGKTSLALHIAANAQKMGKFVYFFDIEHRLKPMHLRGIHNLDVEKMKIIRSSKGNILSGEDFMTIALNILKDSDDCVLIIDSVSGLCSHKEISGDLSGQTRLLNSRIMASFCRQAAPIVVTQNSIVITIHHLIANTSGMGPTQMEDGGRKIKYQGDVMLRCKKVDKWVEDNKQIGQVVEWSVLWSALGPPGRTSRVYLRYGYGVDEIQEIADLGEDFGIISRSGAWYTVDGYEGKYQGRAKLCVEMSKNQEMRTKVLDKVKELWK